MQVQDLMTYLKIVRKWWWVIVLLFMVTVGTMMVMSFLVEKEYEAMVTVQVSAPPPEEAPLYSQFGWEVQSDKIEQARTSFSQLLEKGDVAFLTLEALPEMPMEPRKLRDEKMTIDTLQSNQLLHISVRAADPGMAALLANTMVETGLRRYGELRAQSTANTLKFIEVELKTAQTELEQAEAELAQFQIANKIGTLERAMDNQYNLIRSLQIESDLAQVDGDLVKTKELGARILEREVELQNMIGLSSTYIALSDRVERARTTYNFLLDKLSEARIKENQIREVGFIQVITPAWPPDSPVLAITGKMIALGAIASFMAGVLLTFLAEYLELSGAFRRQPVERKPAEVVILPDSAH